MAGIAFTAGQTMIRPGVYNRYVQVSSPLYEGASDGVVACVLSAQWGPLGEVVELATHGQALEAFGGDGELARQAFGGGARAVFAVRAGTGGAKAAHTLKDAQSTGAVSVTAKYPGARGFACALTGAEGGERQFVLSEDGAVLERIAFSAGGDEAGALIKAGAASKYLDFAQALGYSGTGALAEQVQTVFQAGADPEVDEQDYADALARLTPYAWNCVCLDASSDGLTGVLHSFMKSAWQDGHTGFAVVGEGVSTPLATRMANARAINDYRMVYVSGGWYESGDQLIDGWRAAARVAGMIASVPSNQSLTHRAVSGALRCAEALTNSEYVSCINAGMVAFSLSPSAQVWIENGITALSAPTGEDDAGWMKIKRAKVRFELMDRLSATVAPMIGNVANDDDGRAAVVQAIQGLLRAMIAEGKLMGDAAVALDPDQPPAGDSASFIITANDVDALEKVYFTYQFRFAQQ